MNLKMIGMVAAVVLATLYLIVIVGEMNFKKVFEGEGKKILSQNKMDQRKVIQENDIVKLPKPVQRLLRYSGVISKPMVQTVRLKQKGMMRQSPEDKWLPLEAVQYYSVVNPSFTWMGKIKMNSMLFAVGKDRYIEGKGNMNIKMLATLSVGNFKGKEMDQGAMTRYMNEIMWFPTAYLSENIKWEPINENSAKMIFTYKGQTASAVLIVDQQGKLENFICDRYRTVGDKQVLTRWETPVNEYGEKNGLKIPIKGQGVWKLEQGDFAYIQLEIESIEYDKKDLY